VHSRVAFAAQRGIDWFFAVFGAGGTLAAFWGCVLLRTVNRLARPEWGQPRGPVSRWLYLQFGLGDWPSSRLQYGERTAWGLGTGLTVGLVVYVAI
jgi:hypothetical protein